MWNEGSLYSSWRSCSKALHCIIHPPPPIINKSKEMIDCEMYRQICVACDISASDVVECQDIIAWMMGYICCPFRVTSKSPACRLTFFQWKELISYGKFSQLMSFFDFCYQRQMYWQEKNPHFRLPFKKEKETLVIEVAMSVPISRINIDPFRWRYAGGTASWILEANRAIMVIFPTRRFKHSSFWLAFPSCGG